MFNRFSQYLSYGATDQQTAKDLRGEYTGLLVPGTVAAFQAQGTQGFVLSLSAAQTSVQYAIDPRFPLFQQRLVGPKKSHEALANLLGSPSLINENRDPAPSDFDDARVALLAQAWIDFNSNYQTADAKSFSKYAKRLGEPVVQTNGKGPTQILGLYTMDRVGNPRWWDVSQRLWRESLREATSRGLQDKLVRVVAVDDVSLLDARVSSCPESTVAIWVSNMNELEVSVENQRRLQVYAKTVASMSVSGKGLFALYGGFFAVLLGILGLNGASHGIGYGESRDWHELPQSGPPPARYYLPLAHRYIGIDLALLLWRDVPDLVRCNCAECNGQSPAALSYHGLMRHSVRVRAAEIAQWLPRTASAAAVELGRESALLQSSISNLKIPQKLQRQANEVHRHLPMWRAVLDAM